MAFGSLSCLVVVLSVCRGLLVQCQQVPTAARCLTPYCAVLLDYFASRRDSFTLVLVHGNAQASPEWTSVATVAQVYQNPLRRKGTVQPSICHTPSAIMPVKKVQTFGTWLGEVTGATVRIMNLVANR